MKKTKILLCHSERSEESQTAGLRYFTPFRMTKRRTAFGIVLLAALCTAAVQPGVLPQRNVKRIDSLVDAGLKAGYYPGATVAVGNSRTTLFDACYGWQDHSRSVQVTPDDVYDLASVTKVVATTLAVMRLYDQSLFKLDATLGAVLPEFASTDIGGITMRALLTHTSGLGNISVYSALFRNPAGGALISTRQSEAYPLQVDRAAYLCCNPYADTVFVSAVEVDGYRRAGERCYVNPAVDTIIISKIQANYNSKKAGQYLYSDLNFHLLKLVVEKLACKPFDEFVGGIYAEMQLANTGFRPLQWKTPERIIPTEDDRLMQRGVLRGYTHDEIAAVSDNVGGNAGLFSNAADLSLFCRMILRGGELDGRRILSASTVRLFTTGGTRSLGFARLTSSPAFAGGFGHTGYTGTMIWIDPARDLYMVFLCNRVNPTRTNMGLVTSGLRTKVWEAIVAK